jgi:outer membrane protein OmpA-like peptidoglycan-associated protein
VDKKERTVTRAVERGSRELKKTVETMLETRKAIEGRTVVNLEKKGLEAQAKNETLKFKGITDYKNKTLVEPEKLKDSTALAMDKQAVIRGPQTKLDTDLFSKITGQKMANTADLPRTKYIRRSEADVIEAAQQEAEMRSKALGAVESAARVQADQVDRETLVTKTTVYFAPNSSALDKRYLFALDKIGESSKQFPKRAILVYGHASSDEAEPANLSLQRAKSVRGYLVQNLSLASDKISVKGFGDREPAIKEAQGRDKARNRRVWVQIIQSGN